jgi:uncharacterized protein (DUF736 family)
MLVYFFIPSFTYSATINDDEFNDWSSFSVVTDDPLSTEEPPNLSNGSTMRVATGGNSGAYLQATHTIVAGDSIFTGGIKTNYTYDPSTEGAINTISVTADVKMLPIGSSSWQLVVEQGGVRYFSFPWNSFSNDSWAYVSVSALKATNFDTNPLAGRSGVAPDGRYPEFGSSGEPLQFGFAFGNAINRGSGLINSLGVDNFLVEIAPALESAEITQCLPGESAVGTVSADLDIHVPSLNYQSSEGIQNLQADFEYFEQNESGELLWKLKEYSINQ